VSVVFTLPVVLNPSKIVFGYSGDNFGNIWYFWWQKYAFSHNLDLSRTPFYNAPVGVSINTSFSEFLWMVPGTIISNLSNEVFAFNLLILSGFALSFISMYSLVNYLTKSRWASLFGGLLFSISPYHFWQATAHLSLSLIFWLPLFTLTIFWFDEHKSLKSAFLVSVVFLATIYTTFYYGFFCALIATTYFLLKFVFDFREYFKARTFFLLVFSATIVMLGFAPLWGGLQSAKVDQSRGVKDALSRKLDELVGLSARPWDYLIYPPNQPVFGRFNKQIYDFIQSRGNDFKVRSAYLPERVVFLGIINCLLAFISIIFLYKRDKNIRVILLLSIVSFIVSLPPYFPIKGVIIYTPSYFLYQLFPFIRVYVRMGVFVMLFTTLLSSFTVKAILSRNTHNVGVLLFILIIVGGVFEFLPDFKSFTDLRNVPPVYSWIKSQPGDFIVAEYPENFDLQVGLNFQRYHQKRLFNMPGSEPRFELWGKIDELQEPSTFQVLKNEGVRYLIYHLSDLAQNPYDDWRFFRFALPPTDLQERGTKNAGFRKVATFPEALVYEL
jgi:hypothetical protein